MPPKTKCENQQRQRYTRTYKYILTRTNACLHITIIKRHGNSCMRAQHYACTYTLSNRIFTYGHLGNSPQSHKLTGRTTHSGFMHKNSAVSMKLGRLSSETLASAWHRPGEEMRASAWDRLEEGSEASGASEAAASWSVFSTWHRLGESTEVSRTGEATMHCSVTPAWRRPGGGPRALVKSGEAAANLAPANPQLYFFLLVGFPIPTYLDTASLRYVRAATSSSCKLISRSISLLE